MFLTILGIFALFFNAAYSAGAKMDENSVYLFDFTKETSTVNGWKESSDTVREPGMSKATLTMQNTKLFNRAIFFALLNPQPNGAGFAGMVYQNEKFNLAGFDNLAFNIRAQGMADNYKIILRHKGQNTEPYVAYEQKFSAVSDKNEFQTKILPLNNFKAYYRGKPVPDAEPLELSDITSIGIQVYGGVYDENKHKGVTSLEINWIKAEKSEK